MVFLPTELLTEIGNYLVDDKDDRPRVQAALCALSRACRTFYEVFTPFLYREPVLRHDKELDGWTRTVTSTRALPVVKGRGTNKIKLFKPNKLFVAGERGRPPRYPGEDLNLMFMFGHHRRASLLPSLSEPLITGLFTNLIVLELVNMFASDHFLSKLLAPGQKKRSNLKELTLYSDTTDEVLAPLETRFLLELVRFVRFEWYSPPLDPSVNPYFTYRYPQLLDAPADKATLALVVAEAHRDFASSTELLWGGPVKRHYWSDLPSAEPRFAPVTTVDLSPWSNLRRLTLQFYSSEALCLIFYSPSFPVLRDLTLYGHSNNGPYVDTTILLTFRIATNSLDLPGTLLPPSLEWLDAPLFDSDDIDWVTPPSEKELADYPYKPYRGPKLAFLDLSVFEVLLPS
ncbi:hypothetical protein JCM6882_003556 [Rhodosporidiobolus microsporus]